MTWNDSLEREYQDLVSRLGGDAVATRSANALRRNGITSLSGLALILASDGPGRLRGHLMDFPGMGFGMTERILRTLGVDAEKTCPDSRDAVNRTNYSGEIRKHPCPKCKAGAREMCRSSAGTPLSEPHAARRSAAFPALEELGGGRIASRARNVLLRNNIDALAVLETVLHEEGMIGLRRYLFDMRGMGPDSVEHVIGVLMKSLREVKNGDRRAAG